MLRSWSSRLLGRDRSAGLMIGRTGLGFASVSASRSGRRITRVDERTLRTPLFVGQPTNEVVAALAETLRELAPEAVRGYMSLHVSLPGAAVQVSVFPLDVLPKTRSERLDLVRWHFSQAANGGQTLACDCEPIGMDGDKHLLLGFAMDQAWHRCIADALAQAGMVTWSLNADVCRQFNRFHAQLSKDGQGGALFAAAQDAWSLLLWDELGRVRYCGSRWRSGKEDEYPEVAAEIERRILACVSHSPALKIERLYVVADSEEAGFLAAFDARLHEPCVRLQAEDDYELDTRLPAGYALASVAAALQP